MPSIFLLPPLLLLLFIITYIPIMIKAVKCSDCIISEERFIGKEEIDCVLTTCEGDYCLLAHYAPTWGTLQWGESEIVKGCVTGEMLKSDVQSHCKTIDNDNEEKKSTCFCNNHDYCNGMKASKKLENQNISLVTCVCNGAHCKSATCMGEFCSFVINHKNKKIEQGCINASLPLMERRFVSACMIPPATGAMHHTVAKSVEDLLSTESCICAKDYCNAEKIEHTEEENQRCQAIVQAEIMGVKIVSQNVTCSGEYCFTTKIMSQRGHLTSYNTMGCVSYIKNEEFAEELSRDGCAKFQNQKLQVEACLKMGYIKNDNQKEEIETTSASNFVTSQSPATEETPTTPFYTTTDHPSEQNEKDSSTFLNIFIFLIVIVGILLIGFAYRHYIVRGSSIF